MPELQHSAPTPPRALRWALGLIVAWLAVGLAWNVGLNYRKVAYERIVDQPPSLWQIGGRQPRALEALLRQAGEARPGLMVQFSVAPEISSYDATIALLWVQHLRPQYNWLLASEVPADFPITLWLAFGDHPRAPGWSAVFETADGGLYARQP